VTAHTNYQLIISNFLIKSESESFQLWTLKLHCTSKKNWTLLYFQKFTKYRYWSTSVIFGRENLQRVFNVYMCSL